MVGVRGVRVVRVIYDGDLSHVNLMGVRVVRSIFRSVHLSGVARGKRVVRVEEGPQRKILLLEHRLNFLKIPM